MFERFETFLETAQNNLSFLGVVVVTAVAIVLLAYWGEKLAYRMNGQKRQPISGSIVITVNGMLGAVAAVLMLWEFPVAFAPPFYKLDFSDIPALIAGICFGPVSGVVVECIKILLKILVVKPTSTAFVGEYANFIIGCAGVVPTAVIYQCRRSWKQLLVGGIAGIVVMSTIGTFLNAVYFLPKFAELFGMPLEAIVAMGTAVNGNITNVFTLVCFAVAPLNLLKGTINLLALLICYSGIMTAVRVVWNR